MIRNRFGVLLAEKRANEGRKISLLEVVEETGIPYRTLFAWRYNKVKRFDAHIIAKLCRYFGVEAGELIERVKD